jgi:hypothetical protein
MSKARPTKPLSEHGSSRDEASRGPVSSDVPKLSDFLSYWLKEIVQPNLAPKTYQTYELFARLHIDPYLGQKRLDKLQVKDVRQWLSKLASVCQMLYSGERRCPARIQAAMLRDRRVLPGNPGSVEP